MAEQVRAWHPQVPLVDEVFHASFTDHAYPAHTHDAWTVLLIDSGAVAYELDGEARIAHTRALTLLPPDVAHDGRSAERGEGFRKRVIYLDRSWLPETCIDASAAQPLLPDARVVRAVEAVHDALGQPGDEVAAEVGVLALADVVQRGLGGAVRSLSDAPLARRLRELLDDHVTENVTMEEAARLLGCRPDHMVRAFTRAYGLPPHRYVVGRRVDRARRLLLAGDSPADVAALVGFYDQAHFTRHFKRALGTTPGAFAA